MKLRIMNFALATLLALPAASALASDDTLVSFKGGIGVDPVANIDADGKLVANVVRGAQPGGLPWVIDELNVRIGTDGSISGHGTGLLFAGGEPIGTRGGVTQVFATLYCGGVDFNSAPADLDLAGNFKLSGLLSSVPPSPCEAPVLLIRNLAGRWFAAGIPKRSGHDD